MFPVLASPKQKPWLNNIHLFFLVVKHFHFLNCTFWSSLLFFAVKLTLENKHKYMWRYCIHAQHTKKKIIKYRLLHGICDVRFFYSRVGRIVKQRASYKPASLRFKEWIKICTKHFRCCFLVYRCITKMFWLKCPMLKVFNYRTMVYLNSIIHINSRRNLPKETVSLQ